MRYLQSGNELSYARYQLCPRAENVKYLNFVKLNKSNLCMFIYYAMCLCEHMTNAERVH